MSFLAGSEDNVLDSVLDSVLGAFIVRGNRLFYGVKSARVSLQSNSELSIVIQWERRDILRYSKVRG